MTEENKYLINYDEIIAQAMKNALYDIFKKAEKLVQFGRHYFVISFLTMHKGVVLSDRIRKMYPEEMTIILQHQFRNLVAKEKYFEVELSFNTISELIKVPYDSIISFADPSVNFELSFDEKVGAFEDDVFKSDEGIEVTDNEMESNLIDFDVLLKKKK